MPTPAEPGQPPQDRPVLEPIRVLRPRRTDALAELMRDMPRGGGYESVTVPPDEPAPGRRRGTPPGDARGTGPDPSLAFDDETQELPAVPPGRGGRHPGSGSGLRRAAVAVGVAAAALAGFAAALLLPARGDAAPAARASSPAASAPAGPAASATPADGTDPDGAGTLREGDSGPEVTELEQRLLRVPDVYPNGSTGGRYDGTLTEAVARFQLWYGIRGDETGVYGNDTRQALESRTTLDGD
ncbi:peptidoglycan-binding domain-containing protein [Streptomyces sp. NPDC047000]|uniref:peptidoglycan-binding domain-containing protein n=1 Tax=Streptomyces sp. NPDC047000 TaxID=3155474 RepID=UPI0033D0E554